MSTCNVEGCSGEIKAKGYCNRHYEQTRRCGKTLKRTLRDPNEIAIKGDIAEIVLYDRKSQEIARAIIDVEDVKKAEKHKWSLSTKGYVATTVKGRIIKIQNILGMPNKASRVVDHRDRNKLNNRKSNYRYCTNKENVRNSGISKNNVSGYKGVSWDKLKQKWRAAIMVNRKSIHLGRFISKIKAAKKYNEAATKHFGEFACLNEF